MPYGYGIGILTKKSKKRKFYEHQVYSEMYEHTNEHTTVCSLKGKGDEKENPMLNLASRSKRLEIRNTK
jgi:hypothetical protein